MEEMMRPMTPKEEEIHRKFPTGHPDVIKYAKQHAHDSV
jgi:hypothetical protein